MYLKSSVIHLQEVRTIQLNCLMSWPIKNVLINYSTTSIEDDLVVLKKYLFLIFFSFQFPAWFETKKADRSHCKGCQQKQNSQ